MPWYGNTAAIVNPLANGILVDTGSLVPGTAASLIDLQVFFYSDAGDAVVEIQRVASGGSVSVMQRMPAVGGWLYVEIHGLSPFTLGERIRVRTVSAITGNVAASLTLKEVR